MKESQCEPVAIQAYELRKKVADLLRDVVGFETVAETHRHELRVEELEWLHRVAENMNHRLKPSLDNLDQVRWTLDKEKGGNCGGQLEEDST
jgi:hypothetical protein